MALRRALHLADDLVLEQVEADEVAAGLAELVTRGTVDSVLADRLVPRFAAEDDPAGEPAADEVMTLGRDLDRLLRSLEHGAAMPELPFVALDATEEPAAEGRAAVTISGRHVALAARGGEGLVFVDARPVGRPFTMLAAPTSKAVIERDASGRTRITWEREALTVELGPDFATVAVTVLL